MGNDKIHLYKLTCNCPYCRQLRFLNERMLAEGKVELNTPEEIRKEVTPSRKELTNKVVFEPIASEGKMVYTPTSIVSKKEQFRGVWITTVRNNDFPSTSVYENGFNVEQFKQEFLAILKRCKELKLNAIFFQVRPEGDAFYESGVNPWSVYLTGEQGVKPNWGEFDPLAWMINATHHVGIEFHAWFNPFRLTPTGPSDSTKESLLRTLSDTHYARRHPDWVYYFNRQIYLNPGIPAVREFIVQTVMEVTEKYEIDAVHFDDFFYTYSYQVEENGVIKVISFADESPDYQTYETYHLPHQTIFQWRESNINEVIRTLSEAISEYNRLAKKSVAFGISPFGIWASAEETGGIGSQTSPNQLSSLSEFVNSKLWIDEQWIDYIVPQNYWSFIDPLSTFADVSDWWNKIVINSKTQLYMGIGLYLYNEDAQNPAWQNKEEIVNQIRYLSHLDHVDGYAFFTYHNLLISHHHLPGQEVLNQAIVSLENEILTNYALIPSRPWLQQGETFPVSQLKVTPCDEGCVLVQFEDMPENYSEYYVIYRAPKSSQRDVIDFNDAASILDVVGKNKKSLIQHYTDSSANPNQTYTYAVSALSQAQVESDPVSVVYVP